MIVVMQLRADIQFSVAGMLSCWSVIPYNKVLWVQFLARGHTYVGFVLLVGTLMQLNRSMIHSHLSLSPPSSFKLINISLGENIFIKVIYT